jgi:hypothetical protein
MICTSTKWTRLTDSTEWTPLADNRHSLAMACGSCCCVGLNAWGQRLLLNSGRKIEINTLQSKLL